MEFPQIAPTSRNFSYGDYPVKATNMMNGFETRILFGNMRFNAELQLQYANIADAEAAKFLQHFDNVTGTFEQFNIGASGNPSATAGPKKGATAELGRQIPGQGAGTWRYKEPPQVTSVYPGVSSVSVTLIAVLG